MSYTYRPHPEEAQSFQIFYGEGDDAYLVAEYLLIQQDEEPDITETTVKNIVTLISFEPEGLIDMRDKVFTRLYFQRLKEPAENGWSQAMFRTNDGYRTVDNALFIYDPEEVDISLLPTLCGTRDGNSGGLAPKVKGNTASEAPKIQLDFDA